MRRIRVAVRKLSLDRKIDKFNLEEELAKQADIFYYYAKKAGETKEERDRLKNDLKKLEGEVTLKIYTGNYPIPLDVGLDKPKPIKLTLATAGALLDTDKDVNEKRQELVVAEGAYSKAAAAEETMQQKRSSLKHLTELYINEYYSQSGAGTGLKVTKGDQKSSEVRKNLNEKNDKRKGAKK